MAKQLYIDFDEYIRQGEPEAAISAEQWKTAIGLLDGVQQIEKLGKNTDILLEKLGKKAEKLGIKLGKNKVRWPQERRSLGNL